MSEDPAQRATQYVRDLERALNEIWLLKSTSSAHVAKVKEEAERYLRDAKYYLSAGKPTTSLASVAYAEGLLDALKILNLAEVPPR